VSHTPEHVPTPETAAARDTAAAPDTTPVPDTTVTPDTTAAPGATAESGATADPGSATTPESTTVPQATRPDAERRYVLRPRPPVRAFVIAAVLALLGAVLAAAASGGWSVLGVLVLFAGLALAGVAGWSMLTMRTFVDVDDQGYRIHGPGTDKSGAWREVTKVTTSAGGSHLTLYHGQVARTHVLAPVGAGDAEMQALVADIAARLDASRGYGETMMVPLIDPHRPQDPQVVSNQ